MSGTHSYLWVPHMLRGRASYRDCVSDAARAAQLQHDDYVIHNAPSLEHSGCFPEHRWITVPPYRKLRLGTPNLPIPRNYNARSHPGFGRVVTCSKDVSIALRRETNPRQRNGIDQFLDRRINVHRRPDGLPRWGSQNRARSLTEILADLWRCNNNGPDEQRVRLLMDQMVRAGGFLATGHRIQRLRLVALLAVAHRAGQDAVSVLRPSTRRRERLQRGERPLLRLQRHPRRADYRRTKRCPS